MSKLTPAVDKAMLALRSLLAALSLAPSDPTTHYHLVQLRQKLVKDSSGPLSASLDPTSLKILESELSKHLPKETDLAKFNDEYLQKHSEDAAAVRAALQVRYELLDPQAKDECSKDLVRTLALESSDLKDATQGLQVLREWKADEKYIKLYLDAARERYPDAGAFKKSGQGAES